jgi:hypothetical protein
MMVQTKLQLAPSPEEAKVTKRVPRTKTSEVPQAVVHGGHRSAVLRVDNLGQQHGRDQLREGVAEAKNKAAGAEHYIAVSYLTGKKEMSYTSAHVFTKQDLLP